MKGIKMKKPSYKKLRRAFLLTLASHPDMGKCQDAEFVEKVSKEILKKWNLDGTRKEKSVKV